MTYVEAFANADSLTTFDMIVFDEAHCLRNHKTKIATMLKDATANAFKVLLTATPMQKSIMDLYGLIHFIDDTVLGDADEFYARYYCKSEKYHELSESVSRFCFRTTRAQVGNYTKIPGRIPITIEYEMSGIERNLYDLIEKYLSCENKTAFPDMDEHRLALKMYRSFSSSTCAFIKFLSGVENRLKQGEERDEINITITISSIINHVK